MNYLHRLAATARNPASPIHPVLGSMFSTPNRIDREVVIAAPAQSAPVAPAAVAPASVAPARPCFEPEPAPSISPQRATSSFEPLVNSSRPQWPETLDPPNVELPRETGELFTPAITPSQVADTMTAEFQPPEPPIIVEAQTVLAPTRQPAPAKPARITRAPFKPLIEEPLPRERTPATAREPATRLPAGDGRKQERKDVSRLPAPPSREPDEIRIHIGRIEVTAVPPPQVRSDPKPVNPALNLNDYLKRRSGRS